MIVVHLPISKDMQITASELQQCGLRQQEASELLTAIQAILASLKDSTPQQVPF